MILSAPDRLIGSATEHPSSADRSGRTSKKGFGVHGKGGRRQRHRVPPALYLVAPALLHASMARTQSINELRQMSLSELARIDVSSVSKTSQSLSDAPGAIYVISHEDIVRSGATTVPEMLRLAPNLQVAEVSASRYVITARGMSGNIPDQNFTNKLLVLIDGRSVYTPLYSGVYWDMQDVLPQDIERIEVISGPGATLWGANAVNGVINIITRRSDETQGLLASVNAGANERTAGVRYGGRLGDALTYRAYIHAVDEDQTRTFVGAPAHDGWNRVQGGFRVDWTPGTRDLLTLQGDAYDGADDQPGAPAEAIKGRNLLGRWTRTADDGASSQLQAYWDRTERGTAQGGARFTLDTYDLYGQQSFATWHGNELVAGAGVRASRYDIVGSGGLSFAPPARTLWLANLFAQDTIHLGRRLKLIAGLKLERDPYVDFSLLPSLRIAWKPMDTVLLWSAVSRAVRSPTPFDRDVVEKVGGVTFLTGNDNFLTEKLTAYEGGVRIQATRRGSLSVSAFYNRYDDLRSIDYTPATLIPLYWGNGVRGHSYGLEAWGNYTLTSWWRLGGGVSLLRQHYALKPGGSRLIGGVQLGSDPRYQLTGQTSLNLGPRISLDADMRYVGARPDPHVPHYVEMDARIAWRVGGHLQLSVSGRNLLHAWHQEFTYPDSNQIPRRLMFGAQWRL